MANSYNIHMLAVCVCVFVYM